MDIPQTIRNLAKQKGTTIQQIEKDLQFGNGTIRRWKDNYPSIDKVVKVADHFNVTVNDLIKNRKEEQEMNEEMRVLSELAKPLMEYLEKNHNPHVKVVISGSDVYLEESIMHVVKE